MTGERNTTGNREHRPDAAIGSGEPADTTRPPPRFRTLQSRFLAVNLPLVVLSVVAVIGAFEYLAFRVSHQTLHERISAIAASQSQVIAESLWHLDHERVDVILKAVIVDPEIVSAAVDDELGNRLASAGQIKAPPPKAETIHGHRIVFQSTEGPEKIGFLSIVSTDRVIVAEAQQRIWWGALLCLLLSVSAVVSALVANWRAIGEPLGRLLGAVKTVEESGTHTTVDWKVRDEFGELVAAFNRMQAQQQRYEQELKEAHEDLERRVEERTRELRLARDEAETANQAKTRFLQSMSHELRIPLNAIIGFSDLIRSKDIEALRPGQYQEYAGDIHKSAHFLLDIVNDLLDLSSVEADAYAPEDTVLDPVATVGDCVDMVRNDAQAKDIDLITELPERAPQIRADERMLKQVFLNVLSNAVKFTDTGGRIEARIKADGENGMIFQFSASGRGIAPQDMPRIFQPFNRVVDPLISREEGTGLGLPLAKSLIELHGGDIEIDSTPEVGTVARIRLPAERVLEA